MADTMELKMVHSSYKHLKKEGEGRKERKSPVLPAKSMPG